MKEVAWDWDNRLWTTGTDADGHRTAWPPSKCSGSEARIKTVSYLGTNVETGTSWDVIALDFCTSHGGPTPGVGTVKAWVRSVEQLWKETRYRVRDLGFAGPKARGGCEHHFAGPKCAANRGADLRCSCGACWRTRDLMPTPNFATRHGAESRYPFVFHMLATFFKCPKSPAVQTLQRTL